MALLGQFDPELTKLAWFDSSEVPDEWFDPTVGPTNYPKLVSRALGSGFDVGMSASGWFDESYTPSQWWAIDAGAENLPTLTLQSLSLLFVAPAAPAAPWQNYDSILTSGNRTLVVVPGIPAPIAGGTVNGYSSLYFDSFGPLSIAGCSVWYDATHVTTSGAVITALPDQSGNSRNATITGSPTYTISNSGYNSLPTINRVDATDQILMPNMGITTGAFTLIIVGDAPTAAFNFMLRGGGVDVRAQAGVWRSSANGGATLLDSPAATVINPTILVAVINGASSRLYNSALTATAGTTGPQPDMTGVGMVVGDFLAGSGGNLNFTQVLVYNSALSNADCGSLISYFGTLAGISIGP